MIPGWMTTQEMEWMAHVANISTSIVEVGCWRGRSTQVLASKCPGTVIAVDTWDDKAIGYDGSWTEHDKAIDLYSRPDWLWNEFRYNVRDCSNVIPLRMASLDAARHLASNMVHIDMVFIDADHSYKSVREDILAWKPLLAEHGTICGHDYGEPLCPDVAPAVRSIFPNVTNPVGTIWVA